MIDNKLYVKLLGIQVEGADIIRGLSAYNIKFKQWNERSLDILETSFGLNSEIVNRYKRIRFKPIKMAHLNSEDVGKIFRKGIEEAVKLLRQSIAELDDSIQVQFATNTEIRCETTKGNGINLNLYFTLSDVGEYLNNTNLSSEDKDVVKKELRQIYEMLQNAPLDKVKLQNHQEVIITLLDKVILEENVLQTGVLGLLYQFLSVIDNFII